MHDGLGAGSGWSGSGWPWPPDSFFLLIHRAAVSVFIEMLDAFKVPVQSLMSRAATNSSGVNELVHEYAHLRS